MKEILFIFSNREGCIDEKIEKSLKSFIAKHPELYIEYMVTKHENHLTEKLIEFVQIFPKAVIVVAGGDGSLNEATNALLHAKSQASLCPIPYGTANDFCKILFKEFNFDDFLRDLPYAKIKKIDVLHLLGNLRLHASGPDNIYHPVTEQLNDIFVLNIASFGLDSQIVESAFHLMAKYPKLKGTVYYISVLKNFFKKLKTWSVDYEIDGVVHKKEVLLSAICNGAYYGNGFNPAPNFNLFDGKINYVIAPMLSHFQFAKLAPKYMAGTVLKEKQLTHGTAKKIRVSSRQDEEILANYDGILFKANEFTIEVLPGLLPLAFVGEYAQRLL